MICPICGAQMRYYKYDEFNYTKAPKQSEDCFYGCEQCTLAVRKNE